MIRLGVNFGRNVLEHEHGAIAHDDPPEIGPSPSPPPVYAIFKAKLGVVEVEAGSQIVDDEKGSDAVQRGRLRIAGHFSHANTGVRLTQPNAMKAMKYCAALTCDSM